METSNKNTEKIDTLPNLGENTQEQQAEARQGFLTALQYIRENPRDVIKTAARHDLLAFSRYMQPNLDIQPFHKIYYTVLNAFAYGRIKKLIVTIPPQHGKQISDSQEVVTPNGIKKHGDLSVGDYVFGRNGQPAKVLWTSPKTRSEYVVKFSDGASIECHGNHEWVVFNRSKHKEETLETKAMYASGDIYSGNGKRGSRYKYQVDANVCVNFPYKAVKIDPYTLGAWLGDGKSSAPQMTIGNGDYQIIERIPYKASSFWTQKDTGVEYYYFGKQMKLSEYDLINNKHIPDEYKYNSVDVRAQVIAGLIDTDGYVYQKNGRVTISNTNKRIIDDAAFILRSLGQSVVICSFAPKTSTSGMKGRKVVYQLCFNPTMVFPTAVPRKRVTTLSKNKKRAIVAIEKRDDLGYGNCIQVEGGVYLVGDTFIPTHNSEGSSRKLPAFMLGQNPDKKIAIGSYSTSFARDFNRDVQKIIDTPEYNELFPRTFLSQGTGRKSILSIYQRNSDVIECVGHTGGLRVVGRGGPLTGKPVDVMILDDVYKDYAEANSPIIREAAWKWYTTVVKTRLHNASQELIVFTRWHSDDLVGRIEKTERVIDIERKDDLQNIPSGAWVRINFEAIKTTEKTDFDPRDFGQALWPSKHSLESLMAKRKLDKVQFDCLYQGQPGSVVGRLYTPFKTYTDWKTWGTLVAKGNYTDCADEGTDFLCSVCYNKLISREAKDEHGKPIIFIAVTDVVYSDEPIETTTEAVPMMLNREGTQYANVESNNGGRGFAKIIEPKTGAHIYPFTQRANKESRIITNAGLVSYHVIMPFDWETRYPAFYEAVTTFLRNFKANAHDDACFAAGTKITTLYGDKNIEDINVGDKVITPIGVKRVTASCLTGYKQVINKFGLTATPNHKVFQKKRFDALAVSNEKSLSLYGLKELLQWTYKKQLYSMGKNMYSWGRESIICINQQQMQGGSVLRDCTLRFGNIIAAGKFRKAIVFITRTAIHLTMTSIIWSVSRLANIWHTMREKTLKDPNTGSKTKDYLTNADRKQANGTRAKSAGRGTGNTHKKRIGNQLSNAFAKIAEKLFYRAIKMQSFAAINAANNIGQNSQDLQLCAKSAEMYSRMEVKQNESFAAIHAQQDTTTSTVPVYNITVEDAGCYYANGVLVSNCDTLTGIIEKEILNKPQGIRRKN